MRAQGDGGVISYTGAAGDSATGPARIAFDFPGTANALGRNVQTIDQGDLRSANIVQAGDRTRLVLNLTRMSPYEARVQGRDLIIALSPAAARAVQGTVVSDAFMNSADALIRKQDYLGLLAVCNRRNECIARITSKTLDFATRNPTASFEEVKEVTEAEGNRQSSLLLARIAYLGDVGAVAPMLGLLGTTLGMITTFHEISGKGAGGSNQLGLAQGVSEALLCTASGLVIGIPALMFYAIFRGKVNRLISEMEAATTHLMALLAVQYKRAARAAASV